METILILVAGAAFAIACVTVLAMSARGRRPPLRLPHEHDIAEREEADLIDTLDLPPASPIDREGSTMDLEPIEPRTVKPAPRLPDGETR